jgi:hypothetical protein
MLEFTLAGCSAKAVRFSESDDSRRGLYLHGDCESYAAARRLARKDARAGSVEPDDEFAAMFVFEALARVKARLAHRANWPAVVRLADLLVKQRRIDGPTAEPLWREACRDYRG